MSQNEEKNGRLETGIAGLDSMLDGGFNEGRVVLGPG